MLLTRRAVTLAAGVLLFISFLTIMSAPVNPFYLLTALLITKPPEVAPFTTHIVLFQFKKDVSNTAIKEVTSKMFGLKKACKHPSTRAPYILSITGGKDNSHEDLQNGISHAFVLRFYSNEDRDYYVEADPAHQAFKEAVANVVEKAQVIDFQEGIFM